MPHHPGHPSHHELGHLHPTPPPGALARRMGECPCSECRKPLSKEEEISLLEDYKRGIRERLDHVERRLAELRK